MLHSVSGISFRGDAPVNNQDLISSPGKYTTEAPKADGLQADTFEKGADEDKKSKAPAIIGTIAALAAAAYIGLGIAVGKGKLTKVEGETLKFSEKVQNFFHSIGESAESLWNKVARRGKKAEGEEAPEVKPEEAPAAKAEEAPAAKTEEAPKAEEKAPENK